MRVRAVRALRTNRVREAVVHRHHPRTSGGWKGREEELDPSLRDLRKNGNNVLGIDEIDNSSNPEG